MIMTLAEIVPFFSGLLLISFVHFFLQRRKK
jgi:hypothetical protein